MDCLQGPEVNPQSTSLSIFIILQHLREVLTYLNYNRMEVLP